jgi:hypothetical protein
MGDRHTSMRALAALVGTWQVTGSHPLIEGEITGTWTFEWLEGERFIVVRTRGTRPDVPAALWVIGPAEGDPDGPLVAEYFDSRGVRRTYAVALDDGVWTMQRDHEGFDQRMRAELAPDRFEMVSQLARTRGDWRDDLRLTFERLPDERA